jgi:hypothetical protein
MEDAKQRVVGLIDPMRCSGVMSQRTLKVAHHRRHSRGRVELPSVNRFVATGPSGDQVRGEAQASTVAGTTPGWRAGGPLENGTIRVGVGIPTTIASVLTTEDIPAPPPANSFVVLTKTLKGR